jgi:hypothetical protein
MSEVTPSPDGERTLREAQNLCYRTNVAIVAPEHVLAGALLVLSQTGAEALPDTATIESAIVMSQGQGSERISESVLFGSAARAAINGTAGAIREAGGTQITALLLAVGTIESGEVNPMFYSALVTTKAELLDALGECGPKQPH